MANSHLNPVLLSAYLDDEVSSDERTLVESHLVTCETCQVELDGLRWTANLLHQLPEMPLPRNFYVTEAMLEQPASPIKKSWLQWIQSFFDGIGAVPIGVGATVMALLLLTVIVQPFSTVSEPQLAMVPLATVELPDEEINEEISALAMEPQEEALMNEADDSAMDEAQMSTEESSGEAAAMSEEQLDEVMSENEIFAEDESDASLDTMPAVDEEKNEPEPQETARPARPARSAPTATIEQAQQAVTAPSATLMSTPELSSAVDSTETTDSTEDSAVSQSPSPIASAPKESEPEQATAPSEGDLLSTESNQSAQTMLIVIGMLLLLIFGTIYWRKRSN